MDLLKIASEIAGSIQETPETIPDYSAQYRRIMSSVADAVDIKTMTQDAMDALRRDIETLYEDSADSLSVEQYGALLDVLDAIEKENRKPTAKRSGVPWWCTLPAAEYRRHQKALSLKRNPAIIPEFRKPGHCFVCNGVDVWRKSEPGDIPGPWTCSACHPPGCRADLIQIKGKDIKMIKIPTGPIYRPTGAALEYGELALNLYKGCSHGCLYCYVPRAMRKKRDAFDTDPDPRAGVIDKLRRQCARLTGSNPATIHLTFLGDAYQPAEDELQLTRAALETIKDHGLNFQMLTKGGTRAARDFDLYDHGDRFGQTIIFMDQTDVDTWEPGAPPIIDRINALKMAKQRKIKTWISLEPVIDAGQALQIIRELHPFVDHWKVGKINHAKEVEARTDWRKFRRDVLKTLEGVGADYYLKTSLTEI